MTTTKARIARAIAIQPKIILADEPTGALMQQTVLQSLTYRRKFVAMTIPQLYLLPMIWPLPVAVNDKSQCNQ